MPHVSSALFPAQLPRMRGRVQVQPAHRAPLGCLGCQTEERQCQARGEPLTPGHPDPFSTAGRTAQPGGQSHQRARRRVLLPGAHPALLAPWPATCSCRNSLSDTHTLFSWETRVQSPRPKACAPDRQWPPPSASAGCGFYRPCTAGPQLMGKKDWGPRITPQEQERALLWSAVLVLPWGDQLQGHPSGPRQPRKVRSTTMRTPAQHGHNT